MQIRRLDTASPAFEQALQDLLRYDAETDSRIVETVRSIISDVRRQGDEA
jgi:histidinol dehydrogenase